MNNSSGLFYLIVSTEDHKLLVKGGIGTYLGLLYQAFQQNRPNVHMIWLTESPTNRFISIREGNCRILYIPQPNVIFKIERTAEKIVKLVASNPCNKLIIEAPDWEGILANLYSHLHNTNILKITRLHSILELTKQLHPTFSAEEQLQIQREHKELIYSDILSAPTNYVYNFTRNLIKEIASIPVYIIPNFINNHFEDTSLISRKKACAFYNQHIKNHKINEKDTNIFVIGSLEYRKGTDLAIKIAKKIISKNKNVHFYFFGHYEINGNSLTLNQKYSLKALNAMISKQYSSNIHICGYFNYGDLKFIYSACDTFLFTYRHDNFPGALIEACLSGKNIVYLFRGGCPEIMCMNEQYLGIPFDGHTDTEIVENGVYAVQKSLAEPNVHIAQGIKDKYKLSDILQQMENTYVFKQ